VCVYVCVRMCVFVCLSQPGDEHACVFSLSIFILRSESML